ncbi:hypothetical protein KFU94_15835 [Chloroflexi bacterium TSY]|nr:hypothetical protein [Chloroflexi bacterium TSY]
MTPKSLQSRLKIAKNAKFGSTETIFRLFIYGEEIYLYGSIESFKLDYWAPYEYLICSTRCRELGRFQKLIIHRWTGFTGLEGEKSSQSRPSVDSLVIGAA